MSFHNSNNQDFLKQGRWKIEGLLVARTYPPNFCHYKKAELILPCPPKFQDLPPSLNFVLILSLSLLSFLTDFLETDYYSNIFLSSPYLFSVSNNCCYKNVMPCCYYTYIHTIYQYSTKSLICDMKYTFGFY